MIWQILRKIGRLSYLTSMRRFLQMTNSVCNDRNWKLETIETEEYSPCLRALKPVGSSWMDLWMKQLGL